MYTITVHFNILIHLIKDPPRSNEQVNQENTEKYDIQVDNNRFITTFPVPR